MKPRTSETDDGVSPAGHPTAPGRAKILIVDDRPANLIALGAVLDVLGQEIVTANSGEEALNQLLEDKFAVILMDVRMPGLDGMKTAQLIRQSEKLKSIPIIFLSAFPADTPEWLRGSAPVAADFRLKPMEPGSLRGRTWS